MKRLLSLLMVLVLVTMNGVSLVSCSDGEEQSQEEKVSPSAGIDLSDKEKVVNVYNWGEYIAPGDDGGMDVLAEFEKTTGIKVNYTTFETNEELYNVLKNSNSSYDVIIPSDYMIARLQREGMLEKLDFNNIPNYKNIDERFRTGTYDETGEYTVPYTWGFVALVYNTKMIDGDELSGFADLWNPDYKNQVLMFNNSRDALAIAMQVCDPPIDPGKDSFTAEDIERATDKLVELKECGSLKRYVMDQVFTEMEGSQAGLATYYAGDIATMLDNNEDLDYVIPEEGSNLFVDALCIPTCCKHKKNAEIFIDFMCDPEVAAENANYIYYGTPNKAALELMDEEYTDFELVNPPAEYIDKCYAFTELDDKTYSLMQENFIKACTGKASPGSIWTVIAILSLIVAGTIVVLILNIRRGIKNRGRINKL